MSTPLIDTATARTHVRLEADYPAEQIEPYLRAAEELAAQILNRVLCADTTERDAAIAQAAGIVSDAKTAYDAALLAYRSSTLYDAYDPVRHEYRAGVADNAYESAQRAYRQALTKADELRAAMVATPLIKAAILLIFGHLFENRQQVIVEPRIILAELPMGVHALLQPYRAGMGV